MPKRKKKNRKSFSAEKQGELYALALDIAKNEKLETLLFQTKLPLAWIRKFRAGEILNPSCNRIETLLKAFNAI